MDMLLRQQHRGPDCAFIQPFFRETASSFSAGPRLKSTEAGAFSGKADTWLGHARLSVIDISDNASQPMSNGSQVILFNGEIFNYLEIQTDLKELGHRFHTKSDTEVLLAAFRQWGQNCLERLNGMFAFVVIDLRTGELFLARDRFGIKPLYYAINGDFIVIASEIKGILASSLINAEWDDDIVWAYLAMHMSVAPEGKTFYRAIKQLPPAHYLTINLEKKVAYETKYYNLQRTYPVLPFRTAREEARLILKDACRLRMRSDRNIGLCLSSGIDSSNVAAALIEQDMCPEMFSIQAAIDPRMDEFPLIKELCHALGISTHEVRLPTEIKSTDMVRYMLFGDEPVIFFGSYNQYYLYREMRQAGIVVTMSGHGGDELFCGYQRFYPSVVRQLFTIRNILTLSCWAIKQRHHILDDYHQIMREWLLYTSSASWVDFYEKEIRIVPFKYRPFRSAGSFVDEFVGAENWPQQCLKSVFHYELQYLLRDADRNSMAHGVEERVPLLDHRLLEFCFSQPLSTLCHNGYLKGLARTLFPQIPANLRFHQVKRGLYTDIYRSIPNLWNDLLPVVSRSPLLNRLIDIPALLEKPINNIWWRLANIGVLDLANHEGWPASTTIEDKQINEYLAG